VTLLVDPRPLGALALVSLLLVAACQSAPPPPASTAPGASPAFSALVDEFLDQFATHHPSIAAGNGLHQADGMLEDFSASAVAAEIEMWRGLKTRLAGLDPARLTPDERVDHRIVSGLLDAWLLETPTATGGRT
jgi:uncharacterized protein (DUF885 family)